MSMKIKDIEIHVEVGMDIDIDGIDLDVEGHSSGDMCNMISDSDKDDHHSGTTVDPWKSFVDGPRSSYLGVPWPWSQWLYVHHGRDGWPTAVFHHGLGGLRAVICTGIKHGLRAVVCTGTENIQLTVVCADTEHGPDRRLLRYRKPSPAGFCRSTKNSRGLSTYIGRRLFLWNGKCFFGVNQAITV